MMKSSLLARPLPGLGRIVHSASETGLLNGIWRLIREKARVVSIGPAVDTAEVN